jgi:hypothetical protein
VYRTVSNTLGCYLAARLAPSKPMKHAIILGTIGFALTIVGSTVMWHIPPQLVSYFTCGINIACCLAWRKNGN